MKKLVLGSVALAAMVAGPAMAADMPLKAPAPVVSYYDWSGFYLGASIGGVWTTVDRNYPLSAPGIPAPGTFSSKSSDTIYDIHAGAQVMWGWLVLGVEVGYSAGFKEMTSLSDPLPNPPFTGCDGGGCLAQNKITNLFTVGPRLGIAWDRLMVYGTGGYAAGSIKGSYVCNSNGVQTFSGPTCPGVAGTTTFNNSGSSWNDGWFAGVGFEYMVYKGVLVDAILGAEYQHFDLSAKTAYVAGPPTPLSASFEEKAKGDIVRARLTIKTHAFSILAP
jgi:outer membrane immunogenic protein